MPSLVPRRPSPADGSWGRAGRALVALGTLVLTTGTASGEPLRVGSVAELDLEAVAALAKQMTPAGSNGAPAALVTLEDCLERALEQNLDIQITRLRSEAAEPALAAARARFHPTAGLNGEWFEQKVVPNEGEADRVEEQTATAFVRQAVPTGGEVQVSAGYFRTFSEDQPSDPADQVDRDTTEGAGVGIEVRQPLLKGGRTFVARREIVEAELDLEIQQAELQSQILDVTARTKSAYYAAVLAARLVEVVERALERDAELGGFARALFEAGRVSSRDVLSAELQEATDRALLAERRADLEVALDGLRDVLGLPFEQPVELAEQSIPFEPVAPDLDAWVAAARAERPDLRKLRKELERSEQGLALRRNDLLPSLDAVGSYERAADFQSYRWRAGLGFEMPIGNVGPRGRLRAAEAHHRALEREYRRAERQVEREVREIEIRLRESLSRIATLSAGVSRAREKREIARVRFERGVANSFDITDADRDLVRAESELLDALVDHATQLALLEARIARPL